MNQQSSMRTRRSAIGYRNRREPRGEVAVDALAERHFGADVRRNRAWAFQAASHADLPPPGAAGRPGSAFQAGARVENRCATGSAACIRASGPLPRRGQIVLVVGVEQMTRTPAAEIAHLLRASYSAEDGDTPGGFAACLANGAGLFQKYGDQSDALAMIAARTTRTGVPPYRDAKDLVLNLPVEAKESSSGPLKRTDCCGSDGAAALVRWDAETRRPWQGGQHPATRMRRFSADVERKS